MPFPLYLLALAVFAMGTSEFMLAGLVPDLAADFGVGVGSAGLLTSTFALGMVVGAPLVAVLARRWVRRSALLTSVLLFAVAHVVGALTTSFPVLVGTRAVAALAYAGFLAVALTTAAALVPPERTGRGLAVLLSGTTAAIVAGVPGGAALGALLGWRATFWAVAVLCLPAAVGVLKGVPAGRPPRDGASVADLRSELAQLGRPRLAVPMVLGALVNAATFGAFTYLAPVVTVTAGLDALWVPVALVLFGTGSLLGVAVAGRLSDRRPGTVVAVGGPLLLLSMVGLALLAPAPVALLVLVLVLGGMAFAVGSTLVARVLHEAAAAPTMGGSYATVALNVGATAGPLAAGAALGTGLGHAGPAWLGALLVAVVLLVSWPARRCLVATRSAVEDPPPRPAEV